MMIRMMVRSFLCAVVVLSLATVASADAFIGYNVGLTYQTSYDAGGSDVGQLVYVETGLAESATKTTVTLDGVGVIHEFSVFLTAKNMAAGQDALYFQYHPVVGGATTLVDNVVGDAYAPSALAVTAVNPPTMPAGGSNAALAPPWFLNLYNGIDIAHDLLVGGAGAAPGFGTYGDYAAFVTPGEAGAYNIGTLLLSSAAPGTFDFTFAINPGNFKVISMNTSGVGTLADTSYPGSYTAFGDEVEFIPEPGTLALLATGLIGLLCYAWRRRR